MPGSNTINMKYKNNDDQTDAIAAQVDLEIPLPVGGFESEDEKENYRRKQDSRFTELCAQALAITSAV